jgi:membrane-bound lytic murein transglycosylase D
MNRNFLLTVSLLLTRVASAQMADIDVRFCGESVPRNQPAVSQRWQRTLSRQANLASQLTLLKRRSSVVFPIIEPILEKYGLPQDFKYLPLLESGVSARAISPKGAGGFWQIMPGTARLLGLSMSRHHDERFDLRKSTDAAARYIKSLHAAVGSWMLTALAYNAGPNYIRLIRNRNPSQHALALPLKGETKAYLYQTLALKELLTRPQAYRDYLTPGALASLSEGTVSVSEAERLAILGSFDGDDADSAAVFAATLPADALMLLTDADDEPTANITPDTDSLLAIDLADETAIVPGEALYPTSDHLQTRCLTTGTLTEGQLCTFVLTKAGRYNGQPVQIGDLLYAHVDRMVPEIGRVFLRADRLVSAGTQQAVALNWRAADLPRQPGTALPVYNQIGPDWRLTWEPAN